MIVYLVVIEFFKKEITVNVLNDKLQSRQVMQQQNLPKVTTTKKQYLFSTIGSSIGIACALGYAYKSKKQTNPFVSLKNMSYDEKDILAIGAGAILGGLSGGMAIDKNNNIAKLREASSQFFGSLLCPVGLLMAAENVLDKSEFKFKKLNGNSKFIKHTNNFLSALPKIAVTIGSLVVGMNVGNSIMNKINNKIFGEAQYRKVETSDYLIHSDDLCVALSLLLKDSKGIQSFMAKALPASFVLAGVKTGIANNSSLS